MTEDGQAVEIRELQSEIARHHRDFERIRGLVEAGIHIAESSGSRSIELSVLRAIRMIVG